MYIIRMYQKSYFDKKSADNVYTDVVKYLSDTIENEIKDTDYGLDYLELLPEYLGLLIPYFQDGYTIRLYCDERGVFYVADNLILFYINMSY